MKTYRGAATEARAYVEADRSRADDYYLTEGSGLAQRFSATPDGGVVSAGDLDGDGYERWVAGHDPVTDEPRGRLRTDGNANRFVEITVNGPKTWSIAAALHPAVAAAYEAAQDRTAAQIIGWLAEHSTTRVGPRGRQVQVPVERIEAVTVRHYTSRAGDPHRHLHLQVNARVYAAGGWRGLHTVGFHESIEALNGIGHAAVLTDRGFRKALAAAGFTIDPGTGEVDQLAPFVGEFSARSAQIGRNIDRYEAQWRAANPGQEPGPSIRQSWDRRAWKAARPDKVIPTNGADLTAHWVEQLAELGYQPPTVPAPISSPSVGGIDRNATVGLVLSRLGAKHSAWNAFDIRGEVEKHVAATGLIADAAVRIDLVEDLTHRAVHACVRLVGRADVPEHVRSLTSPRILQVEADIVTSLAARATPVTAEASPPAVEVTDLEDAQQQAVRVLTSDAELIVIEGAAGAGKTTTLKATQESLTAIGRRMVVVTPTRKAAQVAAREVGTASSAAALIHAHGFRWNNDGQWTRSPDVAPRPPVLGRGDLLVVDEAGMLDQDTAHALLTIADELGVRVALIGDRHQLPAVGRGGVLDLAAQWVAPEAHVDLDVVHRFNDPDYAAISLALRTGASTYTPPDADTPKSVWDALVDSGHIRIHASEAERTHTLADETASQILMGSNPGDQVLMVDTREQAAVLNGAIRDRLVTAGYVDDRDAITTSRGERLGVGDQVTTRTNNRDHDVTNRATWTITGIEADGSVRLQGHRATEVRTISGDYARQHVELAYATTVYGAQGETIDTGHLLIGEHTGAASAYVGMTRGRNQNIAHLVADNEDEARAQWEIAFARNRADLGPAVAAERAQEDIATYGPTITTRPLADVLANLHEAWTREADLTAQANQLRAERDDLTDIARPWARFVPLLEQADAEAQAATERWATAREAATRLEEQIAANTDRLDTGIRSAWNQDLALAQQAATLVQAGPGLLGQRRTQFQQATSDLVTFAEDWAALIGDLPHDTGRLAATVQQLRDRSIGDVLQVYVADQIDRAYPDASTIRTAVEAAREEHVGARDHRRSLQTRLRVALAQHGDLGTTRDPAAALAEAATQLARAEAEIEHANRRLERLAREPAIRALPDGALDTEHARWQNNRNQEEQATARAAAEAGLRTEQERLRHSPLSPGANGPDTGYGIGR